MYFPVFLLLQSKLIAILKNRIFQLQRHQSKKQWTSCAVSIPKNHVVHDSNFLFSITFPTKIIIIFNLTYALNTQFLFLVKEKHWKKIYMAFSIPSLQQYSDNFIPLGCSQNYSVAVKCYPEILRKQRYGVNNFYKHLCTQIHHKATSSKGNLAVICLSTALWAPGTDCHPSVLVTKPTHIKEAITAPENFPCKIYAQDQLLMSLSIYSQFCSPFLMLGTTSIFTVVHINTIIKFQQWQQYTMLLLSQVAMGLMSFSEDCQGTSSAQLTTGLPSVFPLC